MPARGWQETCSADGQPKREATVSRHGLAQQKEDPETNTETQARLELPGDSAVHMPKPKAQRGRQPEAGNISGWMKCGARLPHRSRRQVEPSRTAKPTAIESE